MCILLGKQAKALKDELYLKICECSKSEAKANRLDIENTALAEKIKKQSSAIAAMEKELKERIEENTKLKSDLASANNTIKQQKFELAKYKPNRDNKGKFTKK